MRTFSRRAAIWTSIAGVTLGAEPASVADRIARKRFGHIGGNVGYQATLVMFGKSGNGAVIMTNSDVGLRVGNALLNEIAKEYGWNYTAPARIPGG